MSGKRTRLTERELDMSHDGLCGQSIGDGPCSCLVQWVKGLQKESDDAKKSLEQLLLIVVQSNEYNDEKCPEEYKARVRKAREILGFPT